MKKLLLTIAFSIAIQVIAQDLPQPSPLGSSQQQVGLTDIAISYSRPSVKGRVIFGDLIPFGKHWRLGANKNSTISFSTQVKLGNKVVEPGTYSISAIVNEDNWTIILNRNADMWGLGDFNADEDLLRLTVPVRNTEPTESLYMGIENLNVESADLVITWSDKGVSIPLKIETLGIAQRNINQTLSAKPEDLKVKRNAARFLIQNNLNTNLATELMDAVLKDKPDNWYNNFLSAQLFANQGRIKDAQKAANRSMTLGRKDAKSRNIEFAYDDEIKAFTKNLRNQ